MERAIKTLWRLRFAAVATVAWGIAVYGIANYGCRESRQTQNTATSIYVQDAPRPPESQPISLDRLMSQIKSKEQEIDECSKEIFELFENEGPSDPTGNLSKKQALLRLYSNEYRMMLDEYNSRNPGAYP